MNSLSDYKTEKETCRNKSITDTKKFKNKVMKTIKKIKAF